MMKKKGHPKFNVPNYGAKKRKRVKERWRKQRGIDNKKRIKMAMMGAEPTIGYRNPESIRHIRASGRRPAAVRSLGELNALIERKGHETHDIVVAHSVSNRTRRLMLELAGKHNVRLANVSAKALEAKREEQKRKEASKPAEKGKKEDNGAKAPAQQAQASKEAADTAKTDEGVTE